MLADAQNKFLIQLDGYHWMVSIAVIMWFKSYDLNRGRILYQNPSSLTYSYLLVVVSHTWDKVLSQCQVGQQNSLRHYLWCYLIRE